MGTTTLLIGILTRNILKLTRSLYDLNSDSKVMAQIVVFVFSVTLTLTFDLCSIFLSHALHMMYWNIQAKFHKNPLSMNG